MDEKTINNVIEEAIIDIYDDEEDEVMEDEVYEYDVCDVKKVVIGTGIGVSVTAGVAAIIHLNRDKINNKINTIMAKRLDRQGYTVYDTEMEMVTSMEVEELEIIDKDTEE